MGYNLWDQVSRAAIDSYHALVSLLIVIHYHYLSFTIICCGWLSLFYYWLKLLIPVSCAMLWVQNAAVGLSLSRHPPRLHQFFCLDVGYVGSWSWLVSSWRTWILIMNIIMCIYVCFIRSLPLQTKILSICGICWRIVLEKRLNNPVWDRLAIFGEAGLI